MNSALIRFISVCLFTTAATHAASVHAQESALSGNSVSDEMSPTEILAEMLDDQIKGIAKYHSDTLSSAKEENPALRTLPEAEKTLTGPASYRMVVEVFKSPKNLGVKKEFVIVTIDGQISNVYVVSTARAPKTTIEGTFPLKIEKRRGKDKSFRPFPFHKSAKYENSPMFWALNIHGPFFIHSTPHYNELGRAASKGCVRLTFPTSMEIFDNVVNRVQGSAVIHIYGSGSKVAREAFESKGLDPAWINERIESDLGDALAITQKTYKGYGHARRGQPLIWPSCDGVDCFENFGVKKPL
ncbi:L,D-transpeptidase family protein [Bdellovibrionota bacterium FG-2]